MTTVETPRRQRLTWMDSLRGVAVLLIVVLHASALAALLSGVPSPNWLEAVNTAVYPYRMPILMFLSGMLLEHALSKPPGRYVLGKVRALVWPYVVWVCIYWAVTGRDGVPEWQEWVATSWLWYIFYLATYFAIAPFAKAVPRWLLPLILWTLSAVASDLVWTDYFLFAGYFFAGHAAWRYRATLARLDRGWILAGALTVTVGLSAAYLAQAAGVSFLLPLNREELLYAPLTIIGITGLILLARRIPDAWTRVIRFVGRNSVVYYLSHYPAQILVTEALGRLYIWDWRAHIGLGVLAALALGTLLVFLRRFPIVEALFVMPWPKRRTRTA